MKTSLRVPRDPPFRRGAGRSGGFTLIELMIVVSIILILIGVAAMK